MDDTALAFRKLKEKYSYAISIMKKVSELTCIRITVPYLLNNSSSEILFAYIPSNEDLVPAIVKSFHELSQIDYCIRSCTTLMRIKCIEISERSQRS